MLKTSTHNPQETIDEERENSSVPSLHHPSFALGVAFGHCTAWLENYSRSTQIPLPVLSSGLAQLFHIEALRGDMGGMDRLPVVPGQATRNPEVRISAVEMVDSPYPQKTREQQGTHLHNPVARGIWTKRIDSKMKTHKRLKRTELTDILSQYDSRANAYQAVTRAIKSGQLKKKGDYVTLTTKPSSALRRVRQANRQTWEDSILELAKEIQDKNQELTRAAIRAEINKKFHKSPNNTTPYGYINDLISQGKLKAFPDESGRLAIP